MRRIMLWSMLRPLSEESAEELLRRDRIGGNTGNLLFTTSVVRALMTSETDQFDCCFGRLDDARVAAINAEYDCFVMPLANAFRPNYMGHLKNLTELVRRLRIPCAVVGVGIQARANVDLTRDALDFDDTVRNFMRAVLDKSAMVGVRGYRTATYLRRLGFSEERDFTVIGCPSMYMKGPALPEIRPIRFSPNVKTAVNGKVESRGNVAALMNAFTRSLTDWIYVPQMRDELLMMRYGCHIMPGRPGLKPEYVPLNRRHPLIREDRCVGFLNTASWLNTLKDFELVCGSNIHGCVAGLLAGVPALVVAPDQRVAEIAEFYDIPALNAEDPSARQSVADAVDHMDFGPMRRGFPARFEHFVQFLDTNGLEHIYRSDAPDLPAPYDLREKQIHAAPPLHAPTVLTTEDRRVAAQLNRIAWKEFAGRVAQKVRKGLTRS